MFGGASNPLICHGVHMLLMKNTIAESKGVLVRRANRALPVRFLKHFEPLRRDNEMHEVGIVNSIQIRITLTYAFI